MKSSFCKELDNFNIHFKNDYNDDHAVNIDLPCHGIKHTIVHYKLALLASPLSVWYVAPPDGIQYVADLDCRRHSEISVDRSSRRSINLTYILSATTLKFRSLMLKFRTVYAPAILSSSLTSFKRSLKTFFITRSCRC